MDRSEEFVNLCKKFGKVDTSQMSLEKRNRKKDKFFIKSSEIYAKLFTNCEYIDNETLNRHGLYLQGKCRKETKKKKKNKEKFTYFISSISEEIKILKPTSDIHKHILNCLNHLLSVFLDIINVYEQNINTYQYKLNKYTNFYFYNIQNINYSFNDLTKINNIIYSAPEKAERVKYWRDRFEQKYKNNFTWKSFSFIHKIKRQASNQTASNQTASNQTASKQNDFTKNTFNYNGQSIENVKSIETIRNEENKEFYTCYKNDNLYENSLKKEKEKYKKETEVSDIKKETYPVDASSNDNLNFNGNDKANNKKTKFPKQQSTYQKSGYGKIHNTYETFLEQEEKEEMEKREVYGIGNEGESAGANSFAGNDYLINNNQKLEFKKYVDLFEKEEKNYVIETKQKITKISNLMNVFVNKIYEQNENLKRIENIIEESIENVSQGNVYLSKIQKKKNFNSIIFFTLIFASIFLFIFDFFR